MTKYFYILLIGSVALLTSCKNPVKEDEKKELVRREYLEAAPQGRHIYYWDGLDEDGNYITPGKYIILIEIKQFQDQVFVTAEDGGKPRKNDTGMYYFAEFYHAHQLLHAEPDPFKIKEGVNITILLSETATVKISMYKD